MRLSSFIMCSYPNAGNDKEHKDEATNHIGCSVADDCKL